MKFSGPIYKRRKPGLGHYNATRSEWLAAWREARVAHRTGIRPNPKTSGIIWVASLIAHYGRADYMDPLFLPAPIRLMALQEVRQLLAKE